jgi:hypothetical protein
MQDIINDMKKNVIEAEHFLLTWKGKTNSYIMGRIGEVYLVEVKDGKPVVTTNPMKAIALCIVNARTQAKRFSNGNGQFEAIPVITAVQTFLKEQREAAEELEKLIA